MINTSFPLKFSLIPSKTTFVNSWSRLAVHSSSNNIGVLNISERARVHAKTTLANSPQLSILISHSIPLYSIRMFIQGFAAVFLFSLNA